MNEAHAVAFQNERVVALESILGMLVIFQDKECLYCKNLPTCMGGCFRYQPQSKVCTLDTDIAGAMKNKYEAHIKNQMAVA